MEFTFKSLSFRLIGDRLCLTKIGPVALPAETAPSILAEVQIEGEHKDSHFGVKTVCSSEGNRLRYVSHAIDGDRLTVRSESEKIACAVIFEGYGDTDAVRIRTEVKNRSDEAIRLEYVSSFVLTGVGGIGPDEERLFLTRFPQGHHRECQPRRLSLYDLGLYTKGNIGQNKVSFGNVGSWSTKEALPQCLIEDEKNGAVLMFEIESNASWYYEISDYAGALYLYLGGPTETCGSWTKVLKPGETYETVPVAIAVSDTVNGVIAAMTRCRRHVAGFAPADRSLPVIYNEYMHFSWDSPTQENTRRAAVAAAASGAEYYVIDCGWHNEEPGSEIYPYVGQWKESRARFPDGVRATLDFIRSLGMKPGLWIEPEIIGWKCKDMLAYYDDDCFLRRGGKKIFVMGRYFLDYRNQKVRDYMDETLRRMIEDYGAAYVKFDYNEDLGVGTDSDGTDSYGEGLEQAAAAFLAWVDAIRARYPDVIFEACASGGMRMDYRTLSHFSLVSTSDQVRYQLYPYIAGNILSAALPEQAAVWSYPVADGQKNEDITLDSVDINMVNSFLGRMHLASRLFELDETKISRVNEGVAYYKSLSEVKKKAVPFFPEGFTDFRRDHVVSGFRDGKRFYLAVWHLKGDGAIPVALPGEIADARIGFPAESDASLTVNGDRLTVSFPRSEGAVFLEITLA